MILPYLIPLLGEYLIFAKEYMWMLFALGFIGLVPVFIRYVFRR